MDIREVFRILGIEVTTDEAIIADAYRTELRKHNPEDDPEGFKAVRSAYEKACDYARSGGKNQINEEDELDPNNPLDNFFISLDRLYRNYKERINPENWKELLSRDVVTDLDTAEDVRGILFSYLPKNFLLPNSVYKVIDSIFFMGENIVELSEICEEGFLRFALAKANDEYFDFEYETLIGTPDIDEEGVVDYYIGRLKDLMSPYSQVEDRQKAIDELNQTGLVHPWIVLLSKRNDLLEGKLTDDQEKELFYQYMEEVPDDQHEIRYRFFEYRVYEIRGLICRKKEDARGSFYYFRLMDYIDNNDDTGAYLASSGKMTAHAMAKEEGLDMYAWDTFLFACRCGGEFELGIKKYEENLDKILKFEEYVFILQNVAEFYLKEERKEDAIKTLLLIPDGADDYYKYKNLSNTSYDIVDRDGYNSREALDRFLKYTINYERLFETIEERSPEEDEDYIDALINEAATGLRDHDAKRTIEYAEKALKLLDSGTLKLDQDTYEVEKLRVYFNLAYGYVINRKSPKSEEIDLNMVEKALEIYKEADRFAEESQRIHYRAAFWNGIYRCYNLNKRYDEAIGFFLEMEEYLDSIKDELNEETYNECIELVYEKLLGFYAASYAKEEARHYLEKLTGTISIKKPVYDDTVLDYECILSHTNKILSNFACEANVFDQKESEDFLYECCKNLDRALEDDVHDVTGFTDYYEILVRFGCAIVKDHKKLFNTLVKEEYLDFVDDVDDETRHLYIGLSRLCLYVGEKEKAKEFASKALEAATRENPYCRENNVTLEEAVEGGKRYASRFELSNLTECYLYLGDIDKAWYYNKKMDDEEMCYYCAKHGCIEKYLNQAQIYAYIGEFDKAIEACDKTDAAEWHAHEEVAMSVRRYVSSVNCS